MPRQGVSARQKKALRDYYQRQVPHPTQKACISWFRNSYNRTLSQSTVSEYLSDHYSHLDTLDPSIATNSFTLQAQRHRPAQWPTLEKVLYEWHQAIEAKGGIITS
jgi:Fission yeast centromere protein N-terminal domain